MAGLGGSSLFPGHLLSRFLAGLLPIHLFSRPSLFLSCSTYPLAIRFLFYRVLRLVLSTLSDGGPFAWSLLLFPSTVFCGDTLTSLPAFTASIYGDHVCCSRLLLWDLRLALVMYCDRFACPSASNASKSLSYHSIALHPQIIR